MTIKRNGDKVILKGGKVSCSCCEGPPPPECCMYPAQALVDELYTVDDLPDEIFVISSLGNIVLPVDRSGPIGDRGIKYYYGDIGGEEISVSLNTDLTEARWLGSAEVDTIGGCLISKLEIDDPGGPTLDQFADTYTATDPQGNPPITLTRESLCVWRGPEPDLYTLRYLDDSASEGFKCKWAFIDSIKDEGQFQNTPTGNYTQPEQENPWVIS